MMFRAEEYAIPTSLLRLDAFIMHPCSINQMAAIQARGTFMYWKNVPAVRHDSRLQFSHWSRRAPYVLCTLLLPQKRHSRGTCLLHNASIQSSAVRNFTLNAAQSLSRSFLLGADLVLEEKLVM